MQGIAKIYFEKCLQITPLKLRMIFRQFFKLLSNDEFFNETLFYAK